MLRIVQMVTKAGFYDTINLINRGIILNWKIDGFIC